MSEEKIFNSIDEELELFLDYLITKTENNIFFWLPLDRFLNNYYVDKDEYVSDSYKNIMELKNAASTVEFYDDDCFYLEKKDSLLFLIHVKQHSQLFDRDDDNYFLCCAPNIGGYFMHICGLTKETETEINNAKKIEKLCESVKQYSNRWVNLDGGELGPISWTIKNILSD